MRSQLASSFVSVGPEGLAFLSCWWAASGFLLKQRAKASSYTGTALYVGMWAAPQGPLGHTGAAWAQRPTLCRDSRQVGSLAVPHWSDGEWGWGGQEEMASNQAFPSTSNVSALDDLISKCCETEKWWRGALLITTMALSKGQNVKSLVGTASPTTAKWSCFSWGNRWFDVAWAARRGGRRQRMQSA